MVRIENAIIMAAGKGERLRPLTLKTPKPLLPIRGTPMIESLIHALIEAGVLDISIVVGYKKEAFSYLASQYGVHLIENPDFEIANNISSLYYARERIGNTLILDGDQIPASNVIRNEVSASGYACKYHAIPTKEWVLDLGPENRILRCHRDGADKGWALMSLSYWIGPEANRLRQLVEQEYHKGVHDVYWDDVPMFLHPDEFALFGYPIGLTDLIEIDSLDEYLTLNQAREK